MARTSKKKIGVYDEGISLVDDVDSFDFVGAGVIATASLSDVEVNIPGGGGFTELVATGTINGINTAFTFIQQPTYIVMDGGWYKVNGGWTWSNPTATLSIPPQFSIYGVA